MPANLGNSCGSGHRLEKVSFHSNPKEVKCQRMFILWHNCTQARLQQYTNRELSDVQAGFRKGTAQRSNCQHPLDQRNSKRISQKYLLLFIDYAKTFYCVYLNKLWKVLKEMGIPDHLTCLLKNLYAGQETTVRTRHGTTNCFQIGKGVH